MIDFKENKNLVELRQKFYKETGTFAVINKKGYIKWLEENLVKNLSLSGVVDSEAELPEVLCRMNSNFKCNCIDNTKCPNFT